MTFEFCIVSFYFVICNVSFSKIEELFVGRDCNNCAFLRVNAI